MRRPLVVLTQPVHDEVRALLARTCEVADASRVADADALMVFMSDAIDDEFLDRCPRLRVVSVAGKGADNFDSDACASRGIRLAVVPDLLSEPTAELALTLALALLRRVREGDALVRSGEFRGWAPRLYGTGFRGLRVGVVGLGAVGRALMEVLRPFGVILAGHDAHGITTPLDELLRESELVFLVLPATEQTFHLFDEQRIASMKRGAYLVNIGRGSVVDEDAVARALESGQLAGYAADVFELEEWRLPHRRPDIAPALLAHPHTLFTPHLGSATAAARLAIEHAAAQAILDALEKSS